MKRMLLILLAALLLAGCAPQQSEPADGSLPPPASEGEPSAEASEPDPLVTFYLGVLRDLYDEDKGLNDGAELLAFDLTNAKNLTDAQKEDLIARAGEEFGIEAIASTYDELCEQGYIDPENPYFEKGLLFVLSAEEDAEKAFQFDAQKWRSGLGAYYFSECQAKRGKDGVWSYELGAHMIS